MFGQGTGVFGSSAPAVTSSSGVFGQPASTASGTFGNTAGFRQAGASVFGQQSSNT